MVAATIVVFHRIQRLQKAARRQGFVNTTLQLALACALPDMSKSPTAKLKIGQ